MSNKIAPERRKTAKKRHQRFPAVMSVFKLKFSIYIALSFGKSPNYHDHRRNDYNRKNEPQKRIDAVV